MTAPVYRLDTGLLKYATKTQAKYLAAVNEHGSYRAASRALGVNFKSVFDSIRALEKNAALRGYAPEHDMVHDVPEPYIVKGTSTYYGDDGKPRGQWVKTRVDLDKAREIMREAVAAFAEDTPKITPAPGPQKPQSDIIPWIQIGDAHLGLLCHDSEVGESFDLKIAEAELIGAIFKLIDECPSSERIVINDLGDSTHYSNFPGISLKSGHSYDLDTRFPKMIRVYSRVMRAIVDRALTKAQHVDVIVNQGNHSRENDIWMRELLEVAYGHTGRVHVLNNDSVFIAYRMGKTLVMVHHSDKCKPRDLIGVMTTDFRKDYGATQFHYIDIGHVHHHFVSKEHPGVVIESWNHLAVTDRWAHDLGYRSRKSISMVFRSRTYGEVGRRILPIQEIRDHLVSLGKGRNVAEKQPFTV